MYHDLRSHDSMGPKQTEQKYSQLTAKLSAGNEDGSWIDGSREFQLTGPETTKLSIG